MIFVGMSPVFEDTIRDWLAENLDLLEVGLTFIKKEHRLGNPNGTSGRVDILAKDKMGYRVVIELKRSKQASRQAIHEVCKYIALLRSQEGLETSKVRAMIVATEWTELIVPFSEYVKSTSHQVEGVRIWVGDDGAVLKHEIVEPLVLGSCPKFFREHMIHFFDDREARDRFQGSLGDILSRSLNTPLGLVLMAIERDDKEWPYPYAVYPIFTRFEGESRDEWVRQYCESEYVDPDDFEETSFEDYCLAEILLKLSEEKGTMEVGNPEKLHTMLESGWTLTSLEREGWVQSTVAVSDEEILVELRGLNGMNSVLFSRRANSGMRMDWRELQEEARECLKGNDLWGKAASWFYGHVDEVCPNADVTVHIYNPQNLPISLIKLSMEEDFRYLPQIEMIALNKEGEGIYLHGGLIWDQTIFPNMEELFPEADGGILRFLEEVHFGLGWELDPQILNSAGLGYGVKISERRKENVRNYDLEPAGGNGLSEVPSRAPNFDRFVMENRGFLQALSEQFQKVAFM